MRLPILALFERSLREESRVVSTYAKRLALVIIILFFLMGAHARSDRVGAAGLDFFESVVHISFWSLSLIGVAYFSSAITEEKEEATLGLLKMSALNTLSILLGKSTCRLLGVMMLVLAQFPFTLLAITLGGVVLNQVVAAYATLLSYLVLLCNVALFASVSCRRTHSATGMTAALVGLLLLGGPIGQVLQELLRNAGVAYGAVSVATDGLMAANSVVRIGEIMASGFQGSPIGAQVLSNLAIGAAFFGLAWATFGHYTRETTEAAPGRTALVARRSPLRLLGVSRPWNSPLAWKDFHFVAGGRLMVLCRFLALAGLVALVAWLHSINSDRPVPAELIGAVLMVACLLMGALELTSHVSKMLRHEVQWHTLSDLALLPRSMHQIFWAKFAGGLPALVPYAVGFFVGVVLCPAGFGYGVEGILGTVAGWHMLCQALAFTFFAAYMSLVLRRAGFLAAFGIWILGNQMASFFLFGFFSVAGPAAGEAIVVIYSLVLVVLAARFYKATIARLVRLAGE